MVSLFKKHPRNIGRRGRAGVDDPPVSKFLHDPAGNLLGSEFHHPEAVKGGMSSPEIAGSQGFAVVCNMSGVSTT